MAVTLGPFDPVQLSVQILNLLLTKKQITMEEADQVLRLSMPNLSDAEKEKVIRQLKGLK